MANSVNVQPSTSTTAMLPATPEEYAALERKLLRKVDLRLMPALICMIVLNYLDRNALPNARVQGIEAHLGLTGNQFNVCISALFAGYLALQIPSNLLLTRVRPSLYLPACMALWGCVSAATAAAPSFAALVACRTLLGLLEAPFFPGALLLLSSWYTPREMATRTAVVYTGSLLSSAFGGLVGAGVQGGLDGVRGLHAWQWLFIIEGGVTVAVSLGSVFVLPDFPANTAWLTEEERALAVHRLHGSRDEERGPLLQGLKMALTDYKVWLLTLVVILKTSAGAVTQFIPTLVATLHYGKVQTLLMTAPPFVFAAIVALVVSVSSDKRGERCLHLVVPLAFALVGFIIAATTHSLAPRYFSLFLALGGVYGCYDITYAWMSSTIPYPIEKRSSAFAIANMVGNIAQVYSPYMYPKSSGPRYLPAMIANSGFVLASIACCAVLYFCLRRENGLLDAAQRLEHDDAASTTSKDRVQERERVTPVTAMDPDFRYML
ncbi:MFS transporter [Cordyceps fumosorosea ARSEF 2679]|uniref:MFS transporter n=1 Tax=Cordyceps fumosorosea (strain ARSEF 2679) TaxID=1081104 RepID=A0A167PLC6_CORFA|nr:MFS transporter [Cordyceps fumosorosea ARSEF 2679]OAA56779.1 MFS transporter [Cordyceps fumosorosea ARSEF 2679]